MGFLILVIIYVVITLNVLQREVDELERRIGEKDKNVVIDLNVLQSKVDELERRIKDKDKTNE